MIVRKDKPKLYKFPTEKIKKRKKEIDLNDRNYLDKVSMWASFYRRFPHRFVSDYFGITLKGFQKFLIYEMMHSSYFTFIASRGLGKSWLTAVYAVTRATLFPGSLIVIASATKHQAAEMLLKIEELYAQHQNIRREIRNISRSDNMPRAEFNNSSLIRVVANNDNARGGRAHVLILDESARMDEKMIASVLRKFKATPRQPEFLSKPEYNGNEKYVEMNQEISLSSATMKIEHLWRTFADHLDKMTDGRDFFACGIPYQKAIQDGLLVRQQVQDEMDGADFNEVIWSMEMDTLFYGSTSGGYFTLDDFIKARELPYPLYPEWAYELIDDKRFKSPTKQSGEIRIMTIDIALTNAEYGDNSVITVVRLIPNGNTYLRYYSNMIAIHGSNTDDLVLLIKRTYEDFDCDYVAMDLKTIGIAIYDRLAVLTEDPDRGTYYQGWKAMNDDDLARRKHDPDAIPLLYAIKANDRLNTTIAFNFKDHLNRGLVKLPVNKHEGRENLKSLKNFDKLSPENKAMFSAQYEQFDTLITEMVNLNYEMNEKNGTLKFTTDRSNKKDRYSSASYADYFADILQKDLHDDEGSWEDYMIWG